MSKRKLPAGRAGMIVYWIATIWLAVGMLSTGIIQLLHVKEETAYIIEMGYPVYFLSLLGVAKILGVLVLLAPGFLLLKEWAYAGFFFMMAGAVFSHIAVGNGAGEILPPFLLLLLTGVSWYCRPTGRKLILANQ